MCLGLSREERRGRGSRCLVLYFQGRPAAGAIWVCRWAIDQSTGGLPLRGWWCFGPSGLADISLISSGLSSCTSPHTSHPSISHATGAWQSPARPPDAPLATSNLAQQAPCTSKQWAVGRRRTEKNYKHQKVVSAKPLTKQAQRLHSNALSSSRSAPVLLRWAAYQAHLCS
ncbi:hypothetical protein N431DRAFT_12947 [Stipitochalara longipes BDJ]|nr:hypothetical protein N431DRAFT_12947 [Stipitochalara longipes BDJ]